MKLKKLTALISGVLVSTMILSGCSTEGNALYNAFKNSQKINSMESTTTINFNIAGTNLSDQEKQMMQAINIINGSDITVTTKTNQNDAKTIGQAQGDISMKISGIPMDMSFWAKTDITGDKPQIYEVVKLPAIAASSFPEPYKGKPYMVMDLNSINNTSGASQMDYSKLINFSKDFQSKLTVFMDKYAAQYNPDLKVITNLGPQTISQGGSSQSVNMYEIKLTDSTFKQLLKYSVDNFASNTDAVNLIKDYIEAVASVGGAADAAELNKVLEELPTALSNASAAIDKLQDVTLIGPKGIDIKYAVNNDGYIINEDAKCEFVIDIPALSKLAAGSASSAQTLTGIYTVDLGTTTEINKINQNVVITMPTLDASNSFNYADLMGTVTAPSNLKAGWNNNNGKWYYGNADGTAKTGWQLDGGKWYYLQSNGVMKTGWQSEGGKWYYLQSNGAMKTGWQLDGGSWYYLQTNGAMKTGWQMDGGKWYFLQTSGAMKIGWQLDGGRWYFLKTNGEMAANTTVGGYKLGSDGVWIN